MRRAISTSKKGLAAKNGVVSAEYSSSVIDFFVARPSASTHVRTCRASGRKLLDCRDQSRGPAGPEIIAYISSITAPISLSSLTGEAERSPDWHDCDNLQPA